MEKKSDILDIMPRPKWCSVCTVPPNPEARKAATEMAPKYPALTLHTGAMSVTWFGALYEISEVVDMKWAPGDPAVRMALCDTNMGRRVFPADLIEVH